MTGLIEVLVCTGLVVVAVVGYFLLMLGIRIWGINQAVDAGIPLRRVEEELARFDAIQASYGDMMMRYSFFPMSPQEPIEEIAKKAEG